MRQVRREDTAPEMQVRRYLHRAGLRYRLHGPDLPGRPDIVLPCRRTVVFVNGCFWHGHDCKHGRTAAKWNTGFWAEKIIANRERDRRQYKALRAGGWHVEVVWECKLRQDSALRQLATRLLRR
jgi:DNA mismatch endonuclease (patch repair protein)